MTSQIFIEAFINFKIVTSRYWLCINQSSSKHFFLSVDKLRVEKKFQLEIMLKYFKEDLN